MDKAADSGSADVGSIPVRGAKIKNRYILEHTCFCNIMPNNSAVLS
jgi:hypothetical protein